jgi:putative hydrolase of the HAD superfamily
MLRALLLDLYGTAIFARRPIGETYARLGRDLGVDQDAERLGRAFLAALTAVQEERTMEGDGRAFWREVVRRCTGSADDAYFEAVFATLGDPAAYRLEPTLLICLARLRAAGVRLAVVSNADLRTRPIVAGLGLDRAVDAVLISAEIGLVKPDPRVFLGACARLGVAPGEAVHVGDSWTSDVEGARAAGLHAWHYGSDVRDFAEVERRVLAARG